MRIKSQDDNSHNAKAPPEDVKLRKILECEAARHKNYVTNTTIDEKNNKRTETVCTHKKALIPWYAVVAFGFFTIKYDEKCEYKITALNQDSYYSIFAKQAAIEQAETNAEMEKRAAAGEM